MPRERKIVAFDCETDPFEFGTVPQPFIWGAYDGKEFQHWTNTEEFLLDWMDQRVIMYAHNGGKFDFLYLLPYFSKEVHSPRIINGRIVEWKIGRAILRDSFAIIPMGLAAYAKDEFDYRKLYEENRRHYWNDIVQYLDSDCRNLYELVTEFRAQAGKNATIASCALSFAKNRLSIDPGKTNQRFDKRFRPYYVGGRVEPWHPGIHDDANIFDIKSAYPYAMIHSHPVGNQYTVGDDPNGADFVRVRCWSEGAFPQRTRDGLTFPVGFGEFNVTGWEYQSAIDYGLVSNATILEAIHFEHHIHFREYVDYWFAVKSKADADGDKAKRLVAKIMLNSLYGKLAQDPRRYRSYQIVPLGTPPDTDNGWMVGQIMDEWEVHEREAIEEFVERYGEEWETEPLFLNVATAASITGFVRSMIMEARATIGHDFCLYCDTDSIIVKGMGEESVPLNRNGALGSWEWEGHSPRIWIAGKKLYTTDPLDAGPDAGKVKTACKGARLTPDQIKRVTEGEEVTWRNEAPSMAFNNPPKFIERKIKRTY